MGFIGLLINIDAIEHLIQEKVIANKWKCIIPYKFSQDHLELLFNSIRGAGQYDAIFSELPYYNYIVTSRVLHRPRPMEPISKLLLLAILELIKDIEMGEWTSQSFIV